MSPPTNVAGSIRSGGRASSRVRGGSAFQSLAGGDEPGFHGGDVRGAQAALGLAFQVPDGGLGRVEPLPSGRAEGDLPDPTVRRVRVPLATDRRWSALCAAFWNPTVRHEAPGIEWR